MGLREKRKEKRMSRNERASVALPNAREIEKITPIIKEEFAKYGIKIEKIGPHPDGGLMADARIPVEKIDEMRCALFAHGIVLCSAQAGWGFGVRR